MSDDVPSRHKKVVKPVLREMGFLRLALEGMGDTMPRLTRLVVNSFSTGQINPNDLTDCRRYIDKIYSDIHYLHYSPAVAPEHINNPATKIVE